MEVNFGIPELDEVVEAYHINSYNDPDSRIESMLSSSLKKTPNDPLSSKQSKSPDKSRAESPDNLSPFYTQRKETTDSPTQNVKLVPRQVKFDLLSPKEQSSPREISNDQVIDAENDDENNLTLNPIVLENKLPPPKTSQGQRNKSDLSDMSVIKRDKSDENLPDKTDTFERKFSQAPSSVEHKRMTFWERYDARMKTQNNLTGSIRW